MKPLNEQLAVIRRGVEQIERLDELTKKLERSIATGKPLRVKFGIDPTSIDVHLGHTVPLRKLRQFQQLGHQAVLIIGNYTALVGDPSGRDQTRARLTQEQVEINARDYLRQVSRIIDIEKTEVTHNGDWFSKFTFLDVLKLTSRITVQQMLAREDFANRVKAGTEIRLHECMYPLMQGWDSVAIRADIELGGTDQLFNMMVARDLQREEGQEPQVCITFPILIGTDGERRMGKSLNNYIGVGESAKDQFGKTMRIPDGLMRLWLDLLTDRTPEEIARLTDPQQTSPRDAKEVVAKDIVRFYHGDEAAERAAQEFRDVFRGGKDPDEIPDVAIEAAKLSDGKMAIAQLLLETGLAKSKSEGRRAVEGGGVTIGPDKEKVTDPAGAVAVSDGLIVRVGKRSIVRIRLR
ncbi:tyrosine--tRNA ligase [Planctomycetaceae bacterium SCGC AG-212-F19]|nr:tyrosine--tRNA ligase [Planctomycetaceae bacterium SCGC AG-212-F19]